VTHQFAYKDLLSAPVNVTWEITSQCNLRCRHCLSADIMEHSGIELDFDQCCRFIDEMDRLRVFQVNFGGGEPFLRPDFLDILDYAHEAGIVTCVSTNGTVIDEELARRLGRMELLYLQVSLDGVTAETNDAVRGTGTYDRILSGIRLLAASGVKGLSTNTVVTSANFREILDIYRFGRAFGLKTRLSRFRPSGNAKRVWDELRLDKEQLGELSQFLNDHRDVLTGDSFFSITGKERRELGLNMCGAAKMTCSVVPDGTVYPCAFLQDEPFKSGNVTRESLESIWRGAPAFVGLRNARVESCERCTRFNMCHGGCPAVAYFFTESLDRPDPECLVHLPPYLSAYEPNHGVSDHARTV
jgi:mycofactocin biosynthetic radical S-adenosylmethionine protein MftC